MRRGFKERQRRRSNCHGSRQGNVSNNWGRRQNALLQRTGLHFVRRELRMRRNLAAGPTGSNRRASAVHCHVAGALLCRCRRGEAGQKTRQDWGYRPEQDGPNRTGDANSAHSYQFKLLGRHVQNYHLQLTT